jgi:hypothetical protein
LLPRVQHSQEFIPRSVPRSSSFHHSQELITSGSSSLPGVYCSQEFIAPRISLLLRVHHSQKLNIPGAQSRTNQSQEFITPGSDEVLGLINGTDELPGMLIPGANSWELYTLGSDILLGDTSVKTSKCDILLGVIYSLVMLQE